MATTAVDLVVKTFGLAKLVKLDKVLKGTAASAAKAGQGVDQFTGKLSKSGEKIRRAANGLEFFIDKAGRARKVNGQFVTTAEAAAAGLEGLGNSSKKAAQGVGVLNKAFFKITAVIGTVSSLVSAFNTSIARTESERRIVNLASAYGEASQALEIAERSADKFGISQTEVNNQLANTFARLRPVGVGLADIESIFNGYNTAARLAGATSAEASNSFTQLAQALGSGVLRGDEFNSIAEQAPLVLQAISKETGVAVGSLRDYAAEGLITSETVIKALKRIEEEGADQLAEALGGPQQALKNVAVAAEDLFAELGKLGESGLVSAANAITGALKTIKSNLDLLGPLLTNTFNLIANVVTGFVQGFQSALPPVENFGNKVREVISIVVVVLGDLGRTVKSIFEFIGKIVGQIVSFIGRAGSAILGTIADTGKGAVQNVSNTIRQIASIIAKFVNALSNLGGVFLKKFFNIDIGQVVASPLIAVANGIDAADAALNNYIDSVKSRAAELNFGGGVLPDTGGALSTSTFAPQTTQGPSGRSGKAGKKAGKSAKDQFKKIEEQIAALVRQGNEIGDTFADIFAVKSTPLQEEISGIEDELLSADKRLEELLIKFDKLAQGDPRFDGARSQISTLRERLANFDDKDISKTASERLTQSDREGFEKSLREAQALNAALKDGRSELTATEKLAVKYGDDWENIDKAVRDNLISLAEGTDKILAQNEALKEQRDTLDTLYQGIGNTIENGIISAIDAGIQSLVDGTKSLDKALQEIASGVLKDIGNQLIRFGINAAFSSLGNSGGFLGKLFGGGRAEGGSVSPDKTFLVGEKGPELFTPSTNGTILPNDFFDSARAALQTSGGDVADDNPEAFAAAAAAIQRNTTNINNRQSTVSQETSFNNFAESLRSDQRQPIRFETIRVGDMDMVTKDEALEIGARSAKAAEANVFSALRNKPSVRRSLGMA